MLRMVGRVVGRVVGRATRLVTAGCAVVALSVVTVPAAQACACGAMVPSSNRAFVLGEAAVIRWDGRTESIDMVLRVAGSTPDAAWIMPVPARAGFALGRPDTLDQLQLDAAPRRVTRRDWTPGWPGSDGVAGGARPPGGAQVRRVTDVGPFRVTTLTGSDGGSVGRWLTDHGYPARDDLRPTFQRYLDQGWEIAAVKLVPGTGQLTGDLPPLRMTFASDEVVYPIALSAHAGALQDVRLFLVTAERMQVATEAAPSMPLPLYFAGRVPAAHTGDDHPLGTQTGPEPTTHLTVFAGSLEPKAITGDYRFVRADDQADYRSEIVHTDPVGERLTVVAVLASPLLAQVVIALALVPWLRRRLRPGR